MSDDQKTYDIGYKKPPRSTQFVPGKSGNPKGKPKGAKNMSTVFFAEANEKITIVTNGKEVRITKLQAAIKRLYQRAIEGHPQATAKVMEISRMLEPQYLAHEEKQTISKTDDEILNLYVARAKSKEGEEK